MKIPRHMIRELAERFPGKKIVCLPEKDPTEVICEIDKDPAGKWSVAVAIIGASKPHHHNATYETYRVIRGSIRFFDDSASGRHGRVLTPRTGFETVGPSMVHSACGIGRPAEVLVIANPAWTPEDHHLREDILGPGRN
ncbi:MAG: hypothetical protein ABSF56_01485 [Minisyncoccia bacterium]